MVNQENFWAGEDEYHKTNSREKLLPNQIVLFSKILPLTKGVKSIIEFGAGTGINLEAISAIAPQVSLSAVEINESACSKIPKGVNVYNESIYRFKPDKKYDLVLTSGFLIHTSDVEKVYDLMWAASSRYILINEYISPDYTVVNYKGRNDLLVKRDFCKELMKRFPLELMEYGCTYIGDRFSNDTMNWFLLEKR